MENEDFHQERHQACPSPSVQELEQYASLLERSSNYRVLRRLRQTSAAVPSDDSANKRGIFLDVETTGLDPAADQVVELAMCPSNIRRTDSSVGSASPLKR